MPRERNDAGIPVGKDAAVSCCCTCPSTLVEGNLLVSPPCTCISPVRFGYRRPNRAASNVTARGPIAQSQFPARPGPAAVAVAVSPWPIPNWGDKVAGQKRSRPSSPARPEPAAPGCRLPGFQRCALRVKNLRNPHSARTVAALTTDLEKATNGLFRPSRAQRRQCHCAAESYYRSRREKLTVRRCGLYASSSCSQPH